MKKLFFFLLITSISFAQIDRVEPPFWWSGMENKELQILFHGKDISNSLISADNAIVEIHTEGFNKDYVYVTIQLPENPKDIEFTFKNYTTNTIIKHTYSIKKRRENSKNRKGFNDSDALYLIMPDRFANGNPTNDSTIDTQEKANRSLPGGRHGGDIQGIINHLDYLQELGITTIWCTPLCEDNDKEYSYHGYAQSDVYKIDSRYGTNEDYVKLSEELHKRNMKLILDYVPNHWGLEHWMYKNKPVKDWFHEFSKFTQTNYRMTTQFDTNAAISEKQIFTDGWFVPTMPDLNQSNKLVLNYLTQNAIWWIEYANLDGIRVDTYTYNDKIAIASWTKAIMKEYPYFNIVGEVWYPNQAQNAYWQADSSIGKIQSYNSHLKSVMDFTLRDAVMDGAFHNNSSWNRGLNAIYNNFTNDFLYKDIHNILVFNENHDTQRLNFTYPKFEDYKLATTLIATVRGIPQLYYGSEIGMTGDKEKGDADIRRDFPGGWQNDTNNAFIKEGRTAEQQKYFDFTSRLFNWRKNNLAVRQGNMKQYAPKNNLYTYFRSSYDKRYNFMVILNNNTEKQSINISDYQNEFNFLEIKDKTTITDIISGEEIEIKETIEIEPKTALLLDFTTLKNISKKKK